jgi:sulfatase maturation enzyme AslB (radical SAM superfamily)
LLVVSVDGPLEIHNSIRGRGSFEHIDKGIQKVLSLSDRPILFINMSLSYINYDQMENMYEIAINWKVDGINFNHLWYQTPKMIELSNEQFPFFEADRISWEIEPNRVDTTKVADSLEAIWKRSRFAPIIVNQIPDLDHLEIASWYHEPEKKVKYETTRCAWIRMKVWPDGSVRPCRNWQVGNVTDEHSMTVWNNEIFRIFRKHLSRGILPICSRCCYLAHR